MRHNLGHPTIYIMFYKLPNLYQNLLLHVGRKTCYMYNKFKIENASQKISEFLLTNHNLFRYASLHILSCCNAVLATQQTFSHRQISRRLVFVQSKAHKREIGRNS